MIVCPWSAVQQLGPLIFLSMSILHPVRTTLKSSSWSLPPKLPPWKPSNELAARHVPWITSKPGSSKDRVRWRVRWAIKMQEESQQWHPVALKEVFSPLSPTYNSLVKSSDYQPKLAVLTISSQMPRRWQIQNSPSWMNKWTWSRSSSTKIVSSETNCAESVEKR